MPQIYGTTEVVPLQNPRQNLAESNKSQIHIPQRLPDQQRRDAHDAKAALTSQIYGTTEVVPLQNPRHLLYPLAINLLHTVRLFVAGAKVSGNAFLVEPSGEHAR